MERPSSQNDLMVIKMAKMCGIKVVTDYDDDVLHLDHYNPMWHEYETLKPIVMECIALSDEIWVSTIGIKKSFGMLNQNCYVVPNAHNDYLQKIKDKKPFNTDSKIVAWRGGGSHQSDMYECAEEVLKIVNGNMDYMFQFIGCRFIYLEQRCGDNYQPVSQMPLLQYYKHLRDLNPNLVFHPLSNTKFNSSKSNIAWLEASFCGAAFAGNTNLPEFNITGTLPFEQMSYLLSQPDILSKANETSWELICDELLLSKTNKIRIERLLSI
jgi:hypothetical protein